MVKYNKGLAAGIGVSTVAAGLLSTVFVGTAAAEDYAGGTPRTSELAVRGSGSATADATAGANGALAATAAVTGGRQSLIPLPLPGTGPSSAFGYAEVSRAVDVGPGTYRVAVTYEGLDVDIEERGGQSAPLLNTIAAFGCAFDCGAPGTQPTARFTELDEGAGTTTVTLTVAVPDGQARQLIVTGRILADANARTRGATAESTVTTTGTTISVNRL